MFDRFQSRNRGSFDFKMQSILTMHAHIVSSFNLVIEVLLISRLPRFVRLANKASFNLVIEVLLISSHP